MCFRWYLKALSQKYATFSGRAHRTEFWCFMLFYLIGYISLLVIDYMIVVYYSILLGDIFLLIFTISLLYGVGLLSSSFLLANLLPNIAVLVRRLHDIGRSGWWCLVCFIPGIGVIAVILFGLLAGSQKDNKYGKNPHNLKNINKG